MDMRYAVNKGVTPEERSANARCAGLARNAPHNGRIYGNSPLTAEHDYDADEMEFIAAMEAYKLRTRHKFPAWSEALSVMKSLGYEKVSHDAPVVA